jgi:hypothetical protein
MGSEAANVSSTQSGAASVGAGDSGGPTDTGDMGSEAANVSSTQSGAASVGMGTFSPYSRPGMIATNIANYMSGNPATSLGLTALGAMMGMPGLGVMNAVNSVYGGGSSGSSTGSGQGEDGSGDGGDEEDGRTPISSFDIALLTPDLLDSYNLAKNRDYRLFQSSNNPFYSLQRNPSGGINNVYTEFKKGGRVGFAEGGSMSKGLDYLSGVERRGYQEGSSNLSREEIINRILKEIKPGFENENSIARMYPDRFRTGLELDYLKTLDPDEIKQALDRVYLQGENFQNPDFSTGRIGRGVPFFRYSPEYMKKVNYNNPLQLSDQFIGYNLRNQLSELESILGKEKIKPYMTKADDALIDFYKIQMSGDSDLQKKLFGEQTAPTVAEQMMSPEDALTPEIPSNNVLDQWKAHAEATQAMKGETGLDAIPEYGFQTGYDFQSKFPNLDPRIGAGLASGYQVLTEGLGMFNPNNPNFLNPAAAYKTALSDATKNIEGIMAFDQNLMTPQQQENRNKYLKSVGQDIVKRQLPYMDQYQQDYQTRISQVDPNALRNRYLQNLQNTSSQDVNQFQSQLRSNLVPRENQPQGLDYLTGL